MINFILRHKRIKQNIITFHHHIPGKKIPQKCMNSTHYYPQANPFTKRQNFMCRKPLFCASVLRIFRPLNLKHLHNSTAKKSLITKVHKFSWDIGDVPLCQSAFFGVCTLVPTQTTHSKFVNFPFTTLDSFQTPLLQMIKKIQRITYFAVLPKHFHI